MAYTCTGTPFGQVDPNSETGMQAWKRSAGAPNIRFL